MVRHRYVDPLWTCFPNVPLDINDDLTLGGVSSDDDGNAIKRPDLGLKPVVERSEVYKEGSETSTTEHHPTH
jgi:hypothetical protein